jgi:hypothetical protein
VASLSLGEQMARTGQAETVRVSLHARMARSEARSPWLGGAQPMARRRAAPIPGYPTGSPVVVTGSYKPHIDVGGGAIT